MNIAQYESSSNTVPSSTSSTYLSTQDDRTTSESSPRADDGAEGVAHQHVIPSNNVRGGDKSGQLAEEAGHVGPSKPPSPASPTSSAELDPLLPSSPATPSSPQTPYPDAGSPPSPTSPDQQPHPINPLNLHLLSHPSRGRGVFAPYPIPAWTILEDSPVLVLSQGEWEGGKLGETVLGEYGFSWSGGGMGIGLGLASLFNHSFTPNVNFVRSPSTSTIRFTTFRAVQKGEELCICYSADEANLWFTPSDRCTAQGDVASTSAQQEDQVVFPALDPEDMDTVDLAEREIRKQSRAARVANIQRDRNLDSTRTRRRLRFEEKEKARAVVSQSAAEAEREIVSPQPMSISRQVALPPSTPSERSTPLSEIPLPTASLPSGIDGPLPPPLHSGPKRRVSDTPAVLCEDLDWGEARWAEIGGEGITNSRPDAQSWGVERLNGFDEGDEVAEDDSTLEVWVVDITEPRLTRQMLHFMKEACPLDIRLRHLKRVAKVKSPGQPDLIRLALCATSDISQADLVISLSTFDADLSVLVPYQHDVPLHPARTPEQQQAKSQLWPVGLFPLPARPSDGSEWSEAKRTWVQAGIHRVLSLATSAKSRGELPVGVYCSSPPDLLCPTQEGFITPTPGLRAEATDTRRTTHHPLRHGALNCIASIARLRTQAPFSEMQPTRNGADYLLTSLSLFITHDPCVMCSMALLHSRVREVFYVFPSKRGGGLGEFGVHARKDLNHRFEVWRWTGVLGDDVRRELDVGEGVEL